MDCSLILESQKVKQQLRHLEKKINDLKVMCYVLNSEKYGKYYSHPIYMHV